MLDNYIEEPLAYVKGDTISFNFIVKNINSDQEFDEIAFTVKENLDDDTPIVSSTLTNGKITRLSYDPETKKALYFCKGTTDETENLKADTFAYYDIRCIFNTDCVSTFMRGRLHVLANVTDFGGEQ